MSTRTYAASTTVDRAASSIETKVKKHCHGLCMPAARLVSYGLNAVRVRTSARYHGYGEYFTFLWHNSFNNVLPDPSLGLGLARETNVDTGQPGCAKRAGRAPARFGTVQLTHHASTRAEKASVNRV